MACPRAGVCLHWSGCTFSPRVLFLLTYSITLLPSCEFAGAGGLVACNSQFNGKTDAFPIEQRLIMHSIIPTNIMISIQLLAIILMQVPLLLPLVDKVFSLHPRGAACYRNHQLCGCAPDRIANHTCCCSRNVDRSRMTADLAMEDGADSCCRHGQRPKVRHSMEMAPCGAASPLFVSSIEDCLYLQYAGDLASSVSRDISFFECPGSPGIRYFDPPDPPPKLILSV
jgi:hypothetical protein